MQEALLRPLWTESKQPRRLPANTENSKREYTSLSFCAKMYTLV